MTYEQAMTRLEEISSQISSGKLNIDDLSAQLKEAKQLVEFCQNRLKKVEEEVKTIILPVDSES